MNHYRAAAQAAAACAAAISLAAWSVTTTTKQASGDDGGQMPPDILLLSPRLHRGWPAGHRHARQRFGGRGPCPYLFAAEDSGGADQGEMSECLREVADLPAAGDVVLLGVQAEVVAQGEEPLEQFPRFGFAAVECERFDQPERAGKELALAA